MLSNAAIPLSPVKGILYSILSWLRIDSNALLSCSNQLPIKSKTGFREKSWLSLGSTSVMKREIQWNSCGRIFSWWTCEHLTLIGYDNIKYLLHPELTSHVSHVSPIALPISPMSPPKTMALAASTTSQLTRQSPEVAQFWGNRMLFGCRSLCFGRDLSFFSQTFRSKLGFPNSRSLRALKRLENSNCMPCTESRFPTRLAVSCYRKTVPVFAIFCEPKKWYPQSAV